MFFKMQNMLTGGRLRIFRRKNTFFRSREIHTFHQICIVFRKRDHDFPWLWDGIEARQSQRSLPRGTIKSGVIRWEKKLYFSLYQKNEIFVVNWVASVYWVAVTARVNRDGGKNLNNVIEPSSLESWKKPIENHDLCSNYTSVFTRVRKILSWFFTH